MRTEADFRNLVVGRGEDGYLVRLGEVATVQLAAENQRSGAATNDGPGDADAGDAAVDGQRAGRGIGRQEGDGADPARACRQDISIEVNIDNSVFILESMKQGADRAGRDAGASCWWSSSCSWAACAPR